MPPILGEVSSRSRHYHALADYACTRKGAHIFFFLERRIIYGGQLIGSTDFGSFYINGPYSPLGKEARAEVYWDESKRSLYESTNQKGVFKVPDIGERCQPYLIRFEDKLGLKGRAILSDQLYFKLGKYGYPLPSNTISGMSFCTLTPGETEIALSLLTEHPKDRFEPKSGEELFIEGEPVPFNPKYGIQNLCEAFKRGFFKSEAHLESTILANPSLLPEEVRPPKGATICRQIPVCPFKPFQLDRADICYYTENRIKEGTIPNILIELKNNVSTVKDIDQIVRYLEWLDLIIEKEALEVTAYLLAPSFSYTQESIPEKHRQRIYLVELGAEESNQIKL